jgi:hypothetical protein
MGNAVRSWALGAFWLVGSLLLSAGVCTAGSGIYVGFGGSYAESRMNDSIVGSVNDIDIPVEFGEATGFNARVGGRLIDLLALEINFDYLSGFEADRVFTVMALPTGAKADLDIMTLMATAKLIPLSIGPTELRILAGAGLMKAELQTQITTGIIGEPLSVTAEDTLPCGEIGLGFGVAITDRAIIGLEGSYVGAFGDFADQDYGIAYSLITAGIDFTF